MMRKIINGEPVMHKHHCSSDQIGEPMTVKEIHSFAVQCLAHEYRQTGARCIIREKLASNEADLEFSSMGETLINVLVAFRTDGSKTIDGIDTTWMIDEYRRTGNIPRVTFAYIETKDGTIPKCGGEYCFSFHSVSLLPDEYNEPLPEELNPVQLAEKYAETWKQLDASIVRPYLDKDFHYKSDWVFDEMPSRYEYLNYFRPKLHTIKRSGSVINVKVGVNRVTGDVGLIMKQGNNNSIILLTTANGRITSAHMADFMPEYEAPDKALPYSEPEGNLWLELYEKKLPTGLKAAGWFIQKYFRDNNIEFPQFRWIQSELCYPAFQHLAFAYKGNIYSVLFEFVNENGNHIYSRDIRNQLRECKKNDLIACTIPLDYDSYEPIVEGNHLISTETREPLEFEERTGNVVMSPWEINNFGVSFVKGQLQKEGKKIMSFCDVLTIEPHIWFEDEIGRKSYVIVNTITGNTPESVNYQLNHQLLMKFLKYEGYYVEVGISPRDAIAYDRDGNVVPLSQRDSMTNPKEILFRDHEFYINYSGLRYIEHKAAENGVKDEPIFTIRED